MKKFILAFLLIISFTTVSQTYNFSQIEYINPNESTSKRPRICLVDGGPLVMFTRTTSGKQIFVNKQVDGAWLGEQLVSSEGIDFQAGTKLGPAIASNGDVVYIAYILDSTPKQIAFQKSTDGGLTFSESQTAYTLGDESAEGIDVLVLPDGNPVIAFIHYGPNWVDADQVVIRSYDEGNTFTDLISIDNLPCECCTPSLVSGDLTYGVSYRDNDENIRTFKIRTSLNEEANFTNAVETDLTEWEVNSCPVSSSDGFLIGDTLYSAWMGKPNGITQVYMSKVDVINDEVFEFSEIDYEDGYSLQNHPRIDGNSEVQIIVWEEFREERKDLFGVIIQDGEYSPSFSFTQGDSLEHKESIDLIFDEAANTFHLVYRNRGENAVVYRTLSPNNLMQKELDENALVVYPNPATSKIKVQHNFNGTVVYRIYNTVGELLVSDKYEGSISISNLQQGNYFIELFDSSKNYKSKFIKI
jgi:hypothetical protein